MGNLCAMTQMNATDGANQELQQQANKRLNRSERRTSSQQRKRPSRIPKRPEGHNCWQSVAQTLWCHKKPKRNSKQDTTNGSGLGEKIRSSTDWEETAQRARRGNVPQETKEQERQRQQRNTGARTTKAAERDGKCWPTRNWRRQTENQKHVPYPHAHFTPPSHILRTGPCFSRLVLRRFHIIVKHVFALLHSNPSSNTDSGQERIVCYIWTCTITKCGYSARLGVPASRAPGCSSTSTECPHRSEIGCS